MRFAGVHLIIQLAEAGILHKNAGSRASWDAKKVVGGRARRRGHLQRGRPAGIMDVLV